MVMKLLCLGLIWHHALILSSGLKGYLPRVNKDVRLMWGAVLAIMLLLWRIRVSMSRRLICQ